LTVDGRPEMICAMGVAALVLGILGILLCLSELFFVGVPLALVGVLLGALGRRAAVRGARPTGVATAGLVVSVVALCLGGTYTFLAFRASGELDKGADAFREKIKSKKEFDEAFKKALEQKPTR
jgi:hypothetical protein